MTYDEAMEFAKENEGIRINACDGNIWTNDECHFYFKKGKLYYVDGNNDAQGNAIEYIYKNIVNPFLNGHKKDLWRISDTKNIKATKLAKKLYKNNIIKELDGELIIWTRSK